MNDSVWLELVRRVKDPEFAAELVKVLESRAAVAARTEWQQPVNETDYQWWEFNRGVTDE